MKKLVTVLVIIILMIAIQAEEIKMNSIYDFTVLNIKGESVGLSVFSGKVILVVNTASKCGFTYQYDGLEKLHQTYKDEGFVILGFPANNFLKQEPGSNKEIAEFCRLNYGVTFPMFSKISVKGKEIHPLYEYLTSKKSGHDYGGSISWNFNKFLISKEGKIINRFGSKVKPENKKIVNAIEDALKM